MKKRNLILILMVLALASCNKKTAEAVSDKQQPVKSKKTLTYEEKLAAKRELAQSIEERSFQSQYPKIDQSEKNKALLEEAKEREDKQKSNSKTGESTSYKTYYENGYAKHNAGNFAGAIADFSRAIELNPQFGDAYNFRGMSKFKSGNTQGACSDWHRAEQLGYSQAKSMITSHCN